MSQQIYKTQILESFPEFKKSQPFIDELMDSGKIMDIKAGNTIIDSGDYIKVIPFLMDGLIKIYREDADGNEILLYYIKSGESCVISITASLKGEKSSIKAYVEEDSTLIAIPIKDFENLLNKYNLLHTFTYDLFNIKYNQLINSIDSLAFTNLRARLYNYLTNEAKSKETNVLVGLTHKKISTDLSTSREVVSRLMYAIQKEGLIDISNKKITLLKLGD